MCVRRLVNDVSRAKVTGCVHRYCRAYAGRIKETDGGDRGASVFSRVLGLAHRSVKSRVDSV